MYRDNSVSFFSRGGRWVAHIGVVYIDEVWGAVTAVAVASTAWCGELKMNVVVASSLSQYI